MRVALLTVLPISDHLPVYVELKLKLPKEGGVRVCGIGLFLVRFAVIFISKYGIAVLRVQAVCVKFKFYVTVVGEKIVVSQ